jgi:hypothetical protein
MKLAKHQLTTLLFFFRATFHSFKHSDKRLLTALQSLMTKGLITFVADKAGNLTDQAEITAYGKKWVNDYINARLFIGLFSCGFSYADRHHEKAGDYKRLAFLPYSTLKLEVYKDCPDYLLPFITDHAAHIQSKKGQPQEISTSGQTTILGYALPVEPKKDSQSS